MTRRHRPHHAHQLVMFRHGARALRERLGISRRELARRAGLSTAHVRRLERGERTPSFAAACALAEALGTDLAGLLGPEGRSAPRGTPAGESPPVDYAKLCKVIMESSLEPLAFIRPDYTYALVSRHVETFTGTTCRNIIGRTVAEVLGQKTFEETIRPHLDRALAGEVARFRTWVDYPMGQRRYMQIGYTPHVGVDGAVQGVMVSLRDLTEAHLAADALQASERKYRALVETLRSGIWQIDAEGITTLVNGSMARMLGYPPDEMIGRHLFDFMDAREVDLCRECLERRRQGVSEQLEFTFLHRDGRNVPVLLETFPLFDGRQRFVGAVASVMDITRRKAMERALRRSEATTRALLDATTDAAVLCDARCNILVMNQGYANRVGHDASSLIGRCVWDLFPADVAARRRCLTEQVLATGRPVRATDEREGIWNDFVIHPVAGPDGTVEKLAVFAHDITAHIRAQQELEKSQQRFRTLFERASVAISVVDGKGRFTDCNPAYEELLGYPREELLTMHYEDITHPDDLPGEREMAKAMLAGGEGGFRMVKRMIAKSGGPVWVDMSVSVVMNERGAMDFGFAMLQDVTDRVWAEQQLLTERRQLMDVLQEMPAFVYLIRPDHRIVFHNREFRRLFGDPGSRPCFEAFLARREPCRGCPPMKALREGRPVTWERSLDNGRHYRITDRPFKDLDGTWAVLGFGIDVTDSKHLELQSRERSRQVRKLALELTRVEEHERHRIARDLHDGPLQQLALSRLQLQGIGSGGLPASTADILASLDTCADELRSVIVDLSPPGLLNGGLGRALDSLARELRERLGLRVDTARLAMPDMEFAAASFLFRACRELLINALKHGGADRAEIQGRMDEDLFILEVLDNGDGFGSAPESGFGDRSLGLASLKRRCSEMGGELSLGDDHGAGARVRVILPLTALMKK